jgi:hypothetical protein
MDSVQDRPSIFQIPAPKKLFEMKKVLSLRLFLILHRSNEQIILFLKTQIVQEEHFSRDN